ncbi:MAG: DNA translocase FtsK 4TM domain-containing protein [Candidatus Margulisbacteria bacterium]|nr:DNA translocase FtsK 4TM domain-containing protein [Candidatus Margulisiibacteriota bacterium]
MAAKKNRSNTKKSQEPKLPSKFKQDIIGILLIAIAIFIFLSNLSTSTGVLGIFIIKKALRSVIGVGIYALPLFVAAYGVIMLLRHEVKELTVRLLGLLVMFLVFITAAQFISPDYFAHQSRYLLVQGGGGAIGYALSFSMNKMIGLAGSYLLLMAFGLIATLLMFNITIQTLISFFAGLFSNKGKEVVPPPKKAVVTQLPLVKSIPPLKQEVIPAPPIEPELKPKPVVEFPMPKFEPEYKEKEAPAATSASGNKYAKYKLPPLDLLEETTAKEKQQAEKLKETTEMRKTLLEEALRNFGVGAHVVSIYQGPAVTRYELQPEPGVKVSRIANLADDIALNLASQGVRIEAPVPGKSVVGIEVPNATVTPVRLKEIVKTNEFMHNHSKVVFGIGKDLAGAPIYGDIAKMPHLLIAGTTGSGKSVCINSLITSILLRARPDEVKMLMIDPKMVELSIYDGIAHLLAPVVTDPRRAAATLKEWVIKEMERRYKLFHETHARNIEAFNHKAGEDEHLPYILVIVDELADLMMIAANEVETSICRIAQMARATGIHLVIATQRPSVDVITGLIKANIPSRIAFAVATQIDSRVILDSSGAEKLLGRGDMLYNPIGAMKPMRAQGSFVTDKETEKIIKWVKDQAEPEYLEEIVGIKAIEFGKDKGDGERETGGRDALFKDVALLIVESGQASTSYVQRKFRIGYNRAARLMDEMQEAGIVSAPEGELKTRRILASREALNSIVQ